MTILLLNVDISVLIDIGIWKLWKDDEYGNYGMQGKQKGSAGCGNK